MFKSIFKPLMKLVGADSALSSGTKAAMGVKPKTTGYEQQAYDSLLKRSHTLLSDAFLAGEKQEDPSSTLYEKSSAKEKVDPQKAKSLLEAIRTRQGEVAARKGLTQTKASLLG